MKRQLPCSILLITVIWCLFAIHVAGAAGPHPLDALDTSEIAAAAAILRGAGHADKGTLFSSITPTGTAERSGSCLAAGEAYSASGERGSSQRLKDLRGRRGSAQVRNSDFPGGSGRAAHARSCQSLWR